MHFSFSRSTHNIFTMDSNTYSGLLVLPQPIFPTYSFNSGNNYAVLFNSNKFNEHL